MATIRNALSLRMKGRAGAYSFYSSNGRQVARVAQNSTNYGENARRSLKQQMRRVRWANMVNFWKKAAFYLKGSFETKAERLTDYNVFMGKNIGEAVVALDRDTAARGQFVPDSFVISEGSLPSISKSINTNELVTNIVCPEDITSSLSLGILSRMLLNSNNFLREGMQLTFIGADSRLVRGVLMGSVVIAYEFTLNTDDQRTLVTIEGGEFLARTSDGLLGFARQGLGNAAAAILSDSTSGKLVVSSEALLVEDDSMIEQFSTSEAVMRAVESYGLDAEKFLDSGDYDSIE